MDTPKSVTDAEHSASGITEDTLLANIWFRPSATLQHILTRCPDKYVSVLLVLGGIIRAVDRAATQNTGDKMSTVGVLLMAIVFGGLTGWITYYVYGWALGATGRWLGGLAGSASLRTVLAWALVPTVVTLALVLPQAVIFGDDLFKTHPIDTSPFAEHARTAFGLIDVAMSAWAVVILVKGIQLLQGFTVARAIANMVLPGSILIAAIALVAGIAKLL